MRLSHPEKAYPYLTASAFQTALTNDTLTIEGLPTCTIHWLVMSGKQAAKGPAGKSKKAAKGGAEEKREDVLQAVVCPPSVPDYAAACTDRPPHR